MAEQSTALEQAKHFIELCDKNGIPVRLAYLFGSYAKGKQQEYSDIDVALVSDVFTSNKIENNHKTALINYQFVNIEVHHFNTNVFAKDDPFINEIKKTGIRIC